MDQQPEHIVAGGKSPIPDHPLNAAPTSAPPEHRRTNYLTEAGEGVKDHTGRIAEAQGSSAERGRYTEHWDSGFAQDGDPYGISEEYTSQSANTIDRKIEPSNYKT